MARRVFGSRLHDLRHGVATTAQGGLHPTVTILHPTCALGKDTFVLSRWVFHGSSARFRRRETIRETVKRELWQHREDGAGFRKFLQRFDAGLREPDASGCSLVGYTPNMNKYART